MIKETIDMLGFRAKDRVSGFEGVIASVGFDLYGCVQCSLTPPTTPDGKLGDTYLFDVHRIEILSTERVMTPPDFDAMAKKPSEFQHGPAEKPLRA